MRRSFVGLGVLVLVACGQSTVGDGHKHEHRHGRVSSELIADAEHYTGKDMGDHELSFTFDDGPGPMNVSGALAEFLNKHKDKNGAPQPIQSTFFVNGACIKKTPLSSGPKNNSCGEPTPNAEAVIDKEAAEGHYIANHTTTHRDIAGIAAGDRVNELKETDDLILKHQIWNRVFFRAPFGSYSAAVFNTLNDSDMKKYAGPIYWNQGGGPTDANRAADWECWQNGMTTKACGDLYLKEIKALGNKGIVLFHDAVGDTNNHDLTNGTGNTFDMVKYIVGELDKDATPWKYKRLDEVPSIKAVLPPCDASCVQCSGPEADKCTQCPDGKQLEAGKCVDATAPVDGGASSSSGTTSSSGSNGDDDDDDKKGSSSGSTSGDEAPPAEAIADESGCSATGGNAGTGTAALVGACLVGLAISLRSKRRRT